MNNGSEPSIVPEPEPDRSSNQVCNTATSFATMGLLVEFEGNGGKPCHAPTTEGELKMTSACYYDLDKDVYINPHPCWLHSAQSLLWPLWLCPDRCFLCPLLGLLCLQSSHPASSSKFSQFLSPTSTCSLLPLGSSSDITPLCGFAFRSPALPSQEDPLTPAVDPITPPWLLIIQLCLGFSLDSAWDNLPYGFTWLPSPSVSALIRGCSVLVTDLLALSYSSSLHPFGFKGLCLPSGSPMVLNHTGSTSVPLAPWRHLRHL